MTITLRQQSNLRNDTDLKNRVLAAMQQTADSVRLETVAQPYPAGSALPSTTIASGSNGLSLPQATVNVASTTGFPTSGNVPVATAAGQQNVAYTGVTATSFTGCSGGTGAMATGGAVGPTTAARMTARQNLAIACKTQPNGLVQGFTDAVADNPTCQGQATFSGDSLTSSGGITDANILFVCGNVWDLMAGVLPSAIP